MAEHIDRKPLLKNDNELENSYGNHIPQPRTVKGDIRVLGELAGSTDAATSLTPSRITFPDSVVDNRENQPRSH